MDVLKTYLRELGAEEARVQFAAQCGTSLGHLRNVSNGQRPLDPKVCVQVEKRSDGAVRRWHLRPDDWWLIWPELEKLRSAPPHD